MCYDKHMLYIDILIFLIIVAYGWAGYRRGFLGQFFDLAGIVVSFILALRYFHILSGLLERWGLEANLSKPAGFFALWLLAQLVFYLITLFIFHFLPKWLETNRANRILGIAPGLAKGLVVVSVVLMIFFILPVSTNFKNELTRRPISGVLIKYSTRAETQFEKILGGANSLNFFTTVDHDEETTLLNFRANQYTVDESAENTMVKAVNAERVKAGLSPLKIDFTIRAVARAHSIDMAKNGYFSHINLAGKTPADRMSEGGVTFWLAGENIALAPTGDLAQIGFMNSPKHRDNILDPKFGRIGIGIIDIGVYGKMVTQNFAD